jgi:hypothetical protein
VQYVRVTDAEIDSLNNAGYLEAAGADDRLQGSVQCGRRP